MDISQVDKFQFSKTFSELEKIKKQFIVKNGADFEQILHYISKPRLAIKVFFLPWYTATCQQAGYDVPAPKKHAVGLIHRTVKKYRCSMATIQGIAEFFTEHFEFFKEYFYPDRKLPNIEFFGSVNVFQRLQFYHEANIFQCGFMDWLKIEIKDDRFREFMMENYGIEVEIHEESIPFPGKLGIPTHRLIYMAEKEKREGIKPKRHSFQGIKLEWGYQF